MTVHELNADHFPTVFQVLTRAQEDKVFSGCQFGVWSQFRSNEMHIGCLGEKHREPSLPYPQGELKKITHSTLFDLSSLTKIISTATLCALLVERSSLTWDTPIARFFPEKKFQGIEIWHLLTHSAGLKWWSPFFEEFQKKYKGASIEKTSLLERQKLMRSLVLAELLQSPPGKEAVYSDLSMLLLGFIIEELAQRDLDTVFYDWIQKPLGLKNMFFQRVQQPLPFSVDARFAATENCPWRGGVLEGVVHDDNCYAMGGYAGHSGLFSNVEEIIKFIKNLWCENFLSHETLQKMWTPYLGIKNSTRTFGWDTPSAEGSSTGSLFSKHSVGHLGFTGTSLWLDLEKKLAVCLLTNRVYPKRDSLEIKNLRPLFHDAMIKDWNSLHASVILK